MPSRRESQFGGKPHDTVADFMATSGAGSPNDQQAHAEFLLRQTQFHERQAAATEKAAAATEKYTRYMFWSVVVLAIASVAQLAVAYFRPS